MVESELAVLLSRDTSIELESSMFLEFFSEFEVEGSLDLENLADIGSLSGLLRADKGCLRTSGRYSE